MQKRNPVPALSAGRLSQIAFQALQLVRLEAGRAGRDPTDVDDWLFSELDLEASEALALFEPYGVAVHTASCFPDGESPKDYDVKHFSGKP